MALPTGENLITLDTAYNGQPFVQLAAKSTIDTNGLDVAYNGAPFWAVSLSSATLNIRSVSTIVVAHIFKIGGVLWSGLKTLGKVYK
ncbi:MAG: hypothetical protein WCO63_15725 [Bacteroidota bacterium]